MVIQITLQKEKNNLKNFFKKSKNKNKRGRIYVQSVCCNNLALFPGLHVQE